jgi:broad specificity phosphatase PhoE
MQGLSLEQRGPEHSREGLAGSIHRPLSMPARLVVVRHGESEANVINKAIREGVIADYPDWFSATPDREIRLSPKGCLQAEETGRWLRQQYPQRFDVIYVSDHTRAKETVAHLCQSAGWGDARIRIDPLLGERNWGNFSSTERALRDSIMDGRERDPLHNPMPDGETLLETRHRSREFLDRCARKFVGLNVLVISHGEYIEALWSEIAHMNTERELAFFKSKEGDIKNCQVVEFSSCNPETDEPAAGFCWSRSSCPHSGISGSWGKIKRESYSAEELLLQVERYPRLSSLLE